MKEDDREFTNIDAPDEPEPSTDDVDAGLAKEEDWFDEPSGDESAGAA